MHEILWKIKVTDFRIKNTNRNFFFGNTEYGHLPVTIPFFYRISQLKLTIFPINFHLEG